MKQKPCAKQSDRCLQIRQLFRNDFTTQEIVEMGFPHLEVTKVRTAMLQKVHQNRNETANKPRIPGRCKGCGGYGDATTFVKGICLACICREETNKVRGGRFRV
jgi:hypothetical protein